MQLNLKPAPFPQFLWDATDFQFEIPPSPTPHLRHSSALVPLVPFAIRCACQPDAGAPPFDSPFILSILSKSFHPFVIGHSSFVQTERPRSALSPTAIRRPLFASLASPKGGEGRGEESNCLSLNKLSIFKQTLFSLRNLVVQTPCPSMSARWQAERPRTASCLNSQRVANPGAWRYPDLPVPLARSHPPSLAPTQLCSFVTLLFKLNL